MSRAKRVLSLPTLIKKRHRSALAVNTGEIGIQTWDDLKGPRSLPIVGTAHVFITNPKQIHHTLENLVEQYGKVVKLRFGPKRSFGVACPQLMEEIVRKEDPVPTRDSPPAWSEYLKLQNASGGLLTSQGEDWARKRKAVRSLMLKPFAMQTHVPMVTAVHEDMCKYVRIKRDNYNFIDNLSFHLYKHSFEVIVSVLYGERANCLRAQDDKRASEFIGAISEILNACYNSLMVSSEFQSKYNTKTWQRHHNAWDIAVKSNRYFTEKMFENILAGEASSTPMALSLLNSSKLSNGDIEFMLLEFLFGGIDTTSNTFGFLLYLLAAHPEKQEKLRAEFDEASKTKDMSDVGTLQSLRYLNCCIKEALRLFPALFINGRTVTHDFISQTEHIEFRAGDNIMFFHYCMGRDKDLWHDSDQFIPERFDRESTSSDSPSRQLVSIPFGFGTRGCIGKRIAEMSLSLGMIKLLNQFNLTIDKRHEFKPVTRALLTPGLQIPIRFNDRQ